MNNVLYLFGDNIYIEVSSAKVCLKDYRLDPSCFVEDNTTILRNEIRFTTLKILCKNIIEPKLFTRIYCKKQYGVPYISTSEMTEIEPPINSRYISKKLTTEIDQYIIRRGQILFSAAGSVGNVIIAPNYLDGVAGTSDILRIIPNENNLGLIFAYLTSSYGANEVTNFAYGAIIKRVRGFQLESLKVPIIEETLIEEINRKIQKSLTSRETSYSLLTQARQLVFEYNNLPPLDEAQPETLDPEKETELQLVSTEKFTADYRLDAHFYNPMAELTVRNIRENAEDYCQLSELVNEIILGKRFKRNYVESDHGTPFLSGKNIIQIRPEVKYLSNSEINFMNELLIKKNWTLVTCSGTIGRTCFVYNNYEDYATSQHILRVNPNEELIDPAYLYCFLSTDYGFHQILRYRYGAVIDEIDDNNLAELLIPIINEKQQKEIGDLVRQAYDLRAEAIRLEDEAQEILTQALTGK